MSGDEPEPLTAPDCDLRSFPDLPLHFQRFRDSDLVTMESPEAIVAAIMLWGAAWHQVPAASLPDDDRVLARYAGFGRAVAQWQAVRDGALRGFVRCSDGRLYHRTLAEKANASWQSRLKYNWQKASDRHRKAQLKLPENERTDFPAFDDWIVGNYASVPSKTQPELPYENSAGTASERASAHTAPGPADARTGAITVPNANSGGTDQMFRRNGPEIPADFALKGREGKGILESTTPNPSSSETREGRLGDADLKVLFDAVCDAAGLNPIQPSAIDRAMTQVEKWRDAGIDFETVVIPSIRAVVLSTSDPTRTLARFVSKVAHEHAKAKAAAKKSEPYIPPQIPRLSPDGEDPIFLPLRTDLLTRLGDTTYCRALNSVTLEDSGHDHAGKHPLVVRGPDHLVDTLRHGKLRTALLTAAKPYGFNDIW